MLYFSWFGESKQNFFFHIVPLRLVLHAHFLSTVYYIFVLLSIAYAIWDSRSAYIYATSSKLHNVTDIMLFQ